MVYFFSPANATYYLVTTQLFVLLSWLVWRKNWKVFTTYFLTDISLASEAPWDESIDTGCNTYGVTFQAGQYTCTAYNDLNSLKMSVNLHVYYKPSCRIRNEETIDGGLNLRCDVDAFPQNVTYIWTHNDQPIPASNGPTLYYRHANSLLKKAKQGDIEAVAAIFGTFACQAENIAGKRG